MKIFITGATGFIGTYVAKLLAEKNHKICCLVRRTSPQLGQLTVLGAKIVMGNVTVKESIHRAMGGSECVIHVAGLYSYWEPDKSQYSKVNVEGTRNVMECALERGVSKVVHVSTVAVFGKPSVSPFTEESRPGGERFSEYSKTKYEGDQVAWDLYNRRKLPVVVVYPGAVLGPGDPKATGEYIMNLIRRRMPATVFEDSVLTWVHVKDVAEIIVRAAEKPNNIGEKYIAGNQRLSFREFNQLIGEVSGVPLPKLQLPGPIAMLNAVLLTGLANVTKKAPPWGMSIDQMRVMREGFKADGSKAERELCIKYTPVRMAIEEAVASYQK